MKILIRGAGDLATGIASRLYGAGHQILMTETRVPLTVRRTVAFSRAVYEGKACVEEMEACLVSGEEEARNVMERGDIAVIVDPEAECRKWYRPDVLVDAVIAKKNLGTKITDAPFVIGVGPGFTAGEDCHCVVETKRGHTLGSIIWKGSAIPNTGVPGNVGGYTTERLLRASADGVIVPKVKIGDYVEEGQVVALTGEKPVYAQMSGVVRGMLQEGVSVWEGLKIGDIDARAQVSHCFTISDKAKAIGGGVLEAAAGFEKMNGKYAVVILAAGLGTRFGGSKLNALVKGKPLYRHMLEKAEAFRGFTSYIVSGDEAILQEAGQRGIVPVKNTEPERGISLSLRLGMDAARKDKPDLQGILFAVCDQPGLTAATLQKIFRTASLHRGDIVCAGCGEKRGNPVLWDKTYFQELALLSGDEGGRQIMKKYGEKIRIVQTDPEELKDIDRRSDIEQ